MLELSAGVIGLAITVIGFLLVRALNRMDKSVDELRLDIKQLATGDTEVRVDLAGVKVRLTAVETDVLALKALFAHPKS